MFWCLLRVYLLCPSPGGIKRWCCLTSVAYIRSAAACAAGRLDSAYWLIRTGSAWLKAAPAQIPLQAWAGAYRGGCPPTACIVKMTEIALISRQLYSGSYDHTHRGCAGGSRRGTSVSHCGASHAPQTQPVCTARRARARNTITDAQQGNDNEAELQ